MPPIWNRSFFLKETQKWNLAKIPNKASEKINRNFTWEELKKMIEFENKNLFDKEEMK